MFRNILGQDHAVDLLKNAISNNRVAQAYLFHGNDGVGKFVTALYFGMALNCYSAGEYRPCGVCESCRKFLSFEHQDFIYIFPTPNYKMSNAGEIKDSQSYNEYQSYMDNKKNTPWKPFFFASSAEIRKESMMMLQQRLELSIHEASYRICIIEGADQMNQSTANAFLKTLEEPPQRTVLILITERLSMLLPTIQSRCQTLYFNPLARSTIEQILQDRFDINPVTSKTASLIANGNLKTAIRLAEENTSENRQMAIDLLQMAANNQDLAFYNHIQKLKDKLTAAFIQELINYLCVLINDLVVIRHHPDKLINIDQVDLLSRIADLPKDHDDAAYRLLIKLEDFKRKLIGHVNPTLVMINVYYELKQLILP